MPLLSAQPPLLTLGMPTFNRGAAVLRTLEAIARMDRVGGRVSRLIVIDNNSTDDTADLVDAFARQCSALPITRVVEMVQGCSAARARCFREASDPYIALMDDDVIPDPGWATAVIRTLDAHPKAGWVGGKVQLAWESGPTKLAVRCRTMLAHQDFGDGARLLDDPEQGMVSAAFAARREAMLGTGWLEHRLLMGRAGAALESGDDYEMTLRLRLSGWEIRYAPDAVVQHLIPAKRQTVEYLAKLARGVSLSKAQLKWLAAGKPGVEWARPRLKRARMKLARARLLEWRPGVRALKLAEHEGRVESWERLLGELGKKA